MLGARAEDRFQVVNRLGKGVAKVNLVKEKDDPTGTVKVLKKIEYSYLPVNVNNARREVSSKSIFGLFFRPNIYPTVH